MKKILLIDAFGLIFRGYYALLKNPLTTPSGMPVSGIFGFWRMVLRAIKELQVDGFIIVFDSPDSFRKEIDPSYKANRQEAPEDLKTQIAYLIDMVKRCQFPYAMQEKTEADDIIGFLANTLSKENQIFILSSDKDLAQLVSEKVLMVFPEKGLTELSVLNPEGVFQKFEVLPNQIADYLALVGDSSDNIPGVSGIGPKTAVKLLQEFHSLENIYNQIQKVKPESLQKKLLQDKENAFLSKQLAVLKSDLFLSLENKEGNITSNAKKLLYEEFKKLGFSSLLQESFFQDTGITAFASGIDSLFDYTPQDLPSQKKQFDPKIQDYKLVITKKQLIDLLDTISRQGFFVLDTETTSTNPLEAELIGVALAWKKQEAFYIPLFSNAPTDFGKEDFFNLFAPILKDPTIKKIGQNIKYDYHILSRFIPFEGIYFDTMVAAYLLEPDGKRYNMDYLAEKYLNYQTILYDTIVPKGKTLLDVELETVKNYSCEDADITLQLYEVLKQKIAENRLNTVFYEIEMPLIPILAEMEKNGIQIDRVFLQKLKIEMEELVSQTEKMIYQEAGLEFNLNSPKQLAEVLFEKMGIPAIRKNKTGYSTDEAVLEQLKSYPIAQKILLYRKYNKLLSTYINALPHYAVNNRIHTSFHQTGTATGRLSSSDPNLQNIPVKEEIGNSIRKAFIPSDGFVFVSADYSQVELRIMAHFSEDPNLLQAFEKQIDVHSWTASLIFDKPVEKITEQERRVAKSINFGIIYGMGAFKLSQQIDIGLKEAKKFIDKYFTVFKGVKEAIEQIKKKASSCGYAETLFGRKRPLFHINSKNKILQEADERIAVNTAIQGTNADILKKVMIRIFPLLKDWGAKMLLQIHDELLFEVPEEKVSSFSETIKDMMENTVVLKLPLKVSIGIGRNWGEVK